MKENSINAERPTHKIDQIRNCETQAFYAGTP